MPEHDAVRFRSPVRYFDLIDPGAWIQCGDGLTQLGRAVGLRISKFLRQYGMTIGLAGCNFLHAKRMNATFREIPGNPVLPD